MKIRIKVPTRLAESLEDKARKAVEEAKEAVANAKKEKQLKQLEELKAKVDDKIAMLKGKKGKKQKVEEGLINEGPFQPGETVTWLDGAQREYKGTIQSQEEGDYLKVKITTAPPGGQKVGDIITKQAGDIKKGMANEGMDEAFDPSAVTDILGVLAGIGGIAATGAAIATWQDKIKSKNPDLYKKLQSLGSSFRKASGIENEGKINEMVDPATSWEVVAAGMAAIGLAPLAISKMHDWWKKKSPGSYKKAQGVSAAMDRSVGGNQPGEKAGRVNPNKTFGPNE